VTGAVNEAKIRIAEVRTAYGQYIGDHLATRTPKRTTRLQQPSKNIVDVSVSGLFKSHPSSNSRQPLAHGFTKAMRGAGSSSKVEPFDGQTMLA
jgi:hypothetical protein